MCAVFPVDEFVLKIRDTIYTSRNTWINGTFHLFVWTQTCVKDVGKNFALHSGFTPGTPGTTWTPTRGRGTSPRKGMNQKRQSYKAN